MQQSRPKESLIKHCYFKNYCHGVINIVYEMLDAVEPIEIFISGDYCQNCCRFYCEKCEGDMEITFNCFMCKNSYMRKNPYNMSKYIKLR
jgi:hypothetical protein